MLGCLRCLLACLQPGPSSSVRLDVLYTTTATNEKGHFSRRLSAYLTAHLALVFLGNEATLLMFDILVFCTIDFYANDFVTATILTFLLSWVNS